MELMKQPMFDVTITACFDTETGKGSHDVRVVGRYKARDGELIGVKQDCTLDEAIDYAKGLVTAFMAGTEA
jgi:hypothetical protein